MATTYPEWHSDLWISIIDYHNITLHPHTLSHSNMIEERRLLNCDGHINYHNICIVEDIQHGRLTKV